MKFSCNQQILSKAISTVSKAVSSKNTLPILKGILIKAEGNGRLTLSASDLDLSIEKIIPDVNVEEEGSAVFSAKLFGDIIRKLPNENVIIKNDSNNSILIKTSASEFKIVGLSPEEFPDIGHVEESEKLVLDKEVLKNMIRKSVFSASIDESKGIITGVLLEIEEKSLRMVALDGFRMAVVKEEMANKSNESKKKLIISASILNDIYKIISDTEEGEDLSLILSNKKAVILLENTKIVLRLLEGEFINYKTILPSESKCKIKVSKRDLHESIERASLLSKEGKNNLIKLMTSSNMLVVTSRSDEGALREEVLMEKEGNDIEIGFNSKYLLDVMKVLDDDEILIEMNESIKPCLIKPISGESFKYLILPVRISSGYAES